MEKHMFEYDGKQIEVRDLTSSDIIAARLFSSSIFKQVTEQKDAPISRDQLTKHLEKQGLWNNEKLASLSKILLDGEDQLSRGGKTKEGEKFTKEQAKELALKMLITRREQLALIASIQKYDHLTVDSIVEEANFNYTVAASCYSNNERVYKDYEDYIKNQNTELAFKCAEAVSKKLYGDASLDTFPEQDFLKKYKFTDEEGRFINEEGKHVTITGQLVEELENSNSENVIEFTEFE